VFPRFRASGAAVSTARTSARRRCFLYGGGLDALPGGVLADGALGRRALVGCGARARGVQLSAPFTRAGGGPPALVRAAREPRLPAGHRLLAGAGLRRSRPATSALGGDEEARSRDRPRGGRPLLGRTRSYRFHTRNHPFVNLASTCWAAVGRILILEPQPEIRQLVGRVAGRLGHQPLTEIPTSLHG